MLTLRRYLVIIVLMFWQGGFTFYAAVVVPISTSVLGSRIRQGFITREVTHYINVAAAVGLMLLAWDVLATRDPSRIRGHVRAGLWLVMAVCQALLLAMHSHLAGLMQEKGHIIQEEETFRSLHRIYLWTHTVQWGAGLVFLALMLGAWQGETFREKRDSGGGATGRP
jgi:hypothetical protein